MVAVRGDKTFEWRLKPKVLRAKPLKKARPRSCSDGGGGAGFGLGQGDLCDPGGSPEKTFCAAFAPTGPIWKNFPDFTNRASGFGPHKKPHRPGAAKTNLRPRAGTGYPARSDNRIGGPDANSPLWAR